MIASLNQVTLVEVYGQRAEAVTELAPGTPILITGKLAKRKTKRGEHETVVSCYGVQPMGTMPATTAPTVAGSADDEIPF
jgi:single-stranded DNA-binding protein